MHLSEQFRVTVAHFHRVQKETENIIYDDDRKTMSATTMSATYRPMITLLFTAI